MYSGRRRSSVPNRIQAISSRFICVLIGAAPAFGSHSIAANRIAVSFSQLGDDVVGRHYDDEDFADSVDTVV